MKTSSGVKVGNIVWAGTSMFQAQMQLPGLPILLTLRSDATIAFTPFQAFPTIIDQPEDANAVKAIFDSEHTLFYLTDDDKQEYNYNTPIAYKEEPLLLRWLQQQHLEQPQ